MMSYINKSQLQSLPCIYMLCDKLGEIKTYNFNEKKFIFVVGASKFDMKGWRTVDGFSFKEKLYILGFSTDVVWRKASIKDIMHLIFKYKLLCPYQFLIAVNNQKVDKYIAVGGLVRAIYLYREVTKSGVNL